MAGVTIKKVTVLNNPASFADPFKFEITYEAIQDLDDDLEWKVVYLSSPGDAALDQELENVLVGPIASGIYKFVLEADAPDGKKIPLDDLIGNTGVVLSCSFQEQEFVRVGFFIHVDYSDEAMQEDPPEEPLFDKLVRNVAVDDPRVTTKPLDFSSTAAAEPQPEQETDPQESLVLPESTPEDTAPEIEQKQDIDLDHVPGAAASGTMMV